MKHVIVIETSDGVDGLTPLPIPEWLQEFVTEMVDQIISTERGICVVQARFNTRSAIAAVHEIYNAPMWWKP